MIIERCGRARLIVYVEDIVLRSWKDGEKMGTGTMGDDKERDGQAPTGASARIMGPRNC